jgi:hypothetical protein
LTRSAALRALPVLPTRSVRGLQLREKCGHGLLQIFTEDVLVSDHTLGVQHVNRGVLVDVPGHVDWSLIIPIPNATPCVAGGLPRRRELRAVLGRFGIDAHQSEWSALESLNERPVVGVLRPAEAAEEEASEVEDDDLAAVIAQPERPAFEVLTL